MTPTTDKMQFALKEQLTEFEAKLKTLEINIWAAERVIAAHPDHQPTHNRRNLLQHNRSEILTKIRRLKEKIRKRRIP